jgi:hypothetical protein
VHSNHLPPRYQALNAAPNPYLISGTGSAAAGVMWYPCLLMASYAFVIADLKCPHCTKPLTDMAWFQWGYCPGQLPRHEYLYRVGDPLRWKRCDDGSIRAWTFFKGDGINVGDPDILDLVARDSGQVFLGKPCASCGTPLGGGAVEIRGGVISRVWLATPQEFAESFDEVDIYTIGNDGSRLPRPDLRDHPFQPATDCVENDMS